MTCTEALDHRWLSEDKVKEAQLPADGLREFNYKFKWLVGSFSNSFDLEVGEQTHTLTLSLSVSGYPFTTSRREERQRAKRVLTHTCVYTSATFKA